MWVFKCVSIYFIKLEQNVPLNTLFMYKIEYKIYRIRSNLLKNFPMNQFFEPELFFFFFFFFDVGHLRTHSM